MSSGPPPIRYTRVEGDVAIAYQVVGDGPVDLIFEPSLSYSLEILWEHPGVARFLHGLASFSRLIMFDPRGFGLSDHAESQTFDDSVADVRAVLDAVGSERAFYLACDVSGRRAITFAVRHPERCAGLVLFGSHPASFRDEPDYPWGASREEFERVDRLFDEAWGADDGVAELIEQSMPVGVSDPTARAWAMRLVRSGGRKDVVMRGRTIAAVDVRSILGAVRAPTLVLHRVEDRTTLIEASRYMAERVPGARFMELPGRDHAPYFDHPDELIDEIRYFLTGSRSEREPDRVLATIMFSDIVASTETASRIGDRRWRDMLDAYEGVVRVRLQEYRGRLVKHTGDGSFASFDSPAGAIRCALAIRDSVRSLGIETRTGIHTGEVELRGDDVGGIAVHIGARVSAAAVAGEVLVSRTVADLVAGSTIEFDDRGTHELKGVSGEWALLAVRSNA